MREAHEIGLPYMYYTYKYLGPKNFYRYSILGQ